MAAYRHPQRSVQRWYGTALAAGWRPADWRWLSAIIWRESGGDPRAYNPERGRRTPRGWGSYGLVQIYAHAHRDWIVSAVGGDLRRLYRPSTNLAMARRLYLRDGRRPWQ